MVEQTSVLSPLMHQGGTSPVRNQQRQLLEAKIQSELQRLDGVVSLLQATGGRLSDSIAAASPQQLPSQVEHGGSYAHATHVHPHARLFTGLCSVLNRLAPRSVGG